MQIVNNNVTAGYYWKNGMPYSDKLTLTEHYRYVKEENGDEWLNFSLMADESSPASTR